MVEVALEGHNPYPVKPAGFLVGSYLAFALYGIHLCQLQTYFSTYSDPLKSKLLVLWVFLLGTLQMVIILGSGIAYYVNGIGNARIWSEFLWPLSFQDGLIPIMAYTGQLFFGRRAYMVLGRPKWFGALVVSLPTITAICGIALAITARLWANDPFVLAADWARTTKTIGVPSQVVAILWMGLSAVVDGGITLVLLWKFRSKQTEPARILRKLTRLTLETVLLTHLCGAVMCVIFLASNAAHRTDKDAFWVLVELITELYALSIMSTINARRRIRGDPVQTYEEEEAKPESCAALGVSEIERRVEGYSLPYGFGTDDPLGPAEENIEQSVGTEADPGVPRAPPGRPLSGDVCGERAD